MTSNHSIKQSANQNSTTNTTVIQAKDQQAPREQVAPREQHHLREQHQARDAQNLTRENAQVQAQQQQLQAQLQSQHSGPSHNHSHSQTSHMHGNRQKWYRSVSPDPTNPNLVQTGTSNNKNNSQNIAPTKTSN